MYGLGWGCSTLPYAMKSTATTVGVTCGARGLPYMPAVYAPGGNWAGGAPYARWCVQHTAGGRPYGTHGMEALGSVAP